MRWVIDGNNVMGSRPDGWWRDRAGAAARLAEQVRRWQELVDDPVILVFDGRPVAEVADHAGAGLEVRFAPGGRDAADDVIAALVADEVRAAGAETPDELVVVTADRGLRARLPASVRVEGPRAFLDRLDPSG